MAKLALFRKDLEPRCAYCSRSNPLSEDLFTCRRYGVVNGAFHCRKFRYDALRRTPPKPAMIRANYLSGDFSLEND